MGARGSPELVCQVNGKPRKTKWEGRYAGLGEGEIGYFFTISFPIAERKITARMANADYTLAIKGNDVVWMNPRGKQQYMPLYQRDKYRENKTRWIGVSASRRRRRSIGRARLTWHWQ